VWAFSQVRLQVPVRRLFFMSKLSALSFALNGNLFCWRITLVCNLLLPEMFDRLQASSKSVKSMKLTLPVSLSFQGIPPAARVLAAGGKIGESAGRRRRICRPNGRPARHRPPLLEPWRVTQQGSILNDQSSSCRSIPAGWTIRR